MSLVIADTSFIVAVLNSKDKRHLLCTKLYNQQQTILIPQSVMAEVAYMIGRDLGNRGVIRFLKQIPISRYRILPLESEDLFRCAELLERYADSRVDFVDVSVAAVAERKNIKRILTLDQRDFQIIRPRHIEHFELFPSQL